METILLISYWNCSENSTLNNMQYTVDYQARQEMDYTKSIILDEYSKCKETPRVLYLSAKL